MLLPLKDFFSDQRLCLRSSRRAAGWKLTFICEATEEFCSDLRPRNQGHFASIYLADAKFYFLSPCCFDCRIRNSF